MKMIHVTIQTKYFEEEIKFFMDHVGLKIENDMRKIGRNMIFLSNAKGETNIEIIENVDADFSGNENISIGFRVSDVSVKRDELIEDGFEVTPIISPMENVEFFFVKDPAGVRIQFMK